MSVSTCANNDICLVHSIAKNHVCKTCDGGLSICIRCFGEDHIDHTLGKFMSEPVQIIPKETKVVVKSTGLDVNRAPRVAKKTLALEAVAACEAAKNTNSDGPHSSTLVQNTSNSNGKRDLAQTGFDTDHKGHGVCDEEVQKVLRKETSHGVTDLSTSSTINSSQKSAARKISAKQAKKGAVLVLSGDALWADNLRQLKRFVHAHGHVDALHVSKIDGAQSSFADLKLWVDVQLSEHAAGSLRSDRLSELQRLVDKDKMKWIASTAAVAEADGDSTSSTHSDEGSEYLPMSCLTKSDASVASRSLTSSCSSSVHTSSNVDLVAVEVPSEVVTSKKKKARTSSDPTALSISPSSDSSAVESVPVKMTASVTPVADPAPRKKNVPTAKRAISAATKKRRDTVAANEEVWWTHYALLLAYDDQHGTFDVPRGHVVITAEGEEVALGEWLHAQHGQFFYDGRMNKAHYHYLLQLCELGRLWLDDAPADGGEVEEVVVEGGGDPAMEVEVKDGVGGSTSGSTSRMVVDVSADNEEKEQMDTEAVSAIRSDATAVSVISSSQESSQESSESLSLDSLVSAAESLLTGTTNKNKRKRTGTTSYRVYLTGGGAEGTDSEVGIGKVSPITTEGHLTHYQMTHVMRCESPLDLLNGRYSQQPLEDGQTERVGCEQVLLPVTFVKAPAAPEDTCAYFTLSSASKRAVLGIKHFQQQKK